MTAAPSTPLDLDRLKELEKARDATIAAQSAALGKAREALKVGRAWTDEYLMECEDWNPEEAERVRAGLATIDEAIAAIDAAISGSTNSNRSPP